MANRLEPPVIHVVYHHNMGFDAMTCQSMIELACYLAVGISFWQQTLGKNHIPNNARETITT